MTPFSTGLETACRDCGRITLNLLDELKQENNQLSIGEVSGKLDEIANTAKVFYCDKSVDTCLFYTEFLSPNVSQLFPKTVMMSQAPIMFPYNDIREFATVKSKFFAPRLQSTPSGNQPLHSSCTTKLKKISSQYVLNDSLNF